jgi:hypothetical protein
MGRNELIRFFVIDVLGGVRSGWAAIQLAKS